MESTTITEQLAYLQHEVLDLTADDLVLTKYTLRRVAQQATELEKIVKATIERERLWRQYGR